MQWNEQHLDIYTYNQKQKYHPMWEQQKQWVQEIDVKERQPSLLLLEHAHVYTLGRGSHVEHLLISSEECTKQGIDLVEIDRGGDITYHGPGQLVGYPLILLNQIGNDAHLYLRKLEEALIQTLAHFGVEGTRKEQYTGVWVQDEKVAAIGVKFNRARHLKAFITSHGFALNVNTDLTMFEQIIPCGIREYGVTSLSHILKQEVDMQEVQHVFQDKFIEEFGFISKQNVLIG